MNADKTPVDITFKLYLQVQFDGYKMMVFKSETEFFEWNKQ